mgnify:FL=1
MRPAPRISLLTLLITVINFIAMLCIVLGVLWVNQRSENLIAAHKRYLEIQANMIASVIAETAVGFNDGDPTLDRELVIPIFRRLIDPDRSLARLYNSDGVLIADSNLIKDVVIRRELAPPGEDDVDFGISEILSNWLTELVALSAYYPYQSDLSNGDEVRDAVTKGLKGETVYISRRNEAGELIVNYALPIQPLQKVLGVLVLEVSDIGDAIRAERQNLEQVFLVAFLVSILTSLLLGRTIARPIRRLASAAEAVRMREKEREEIPDFTFRRDEIGYLSGSLRAMTSALYDRIDAIESFAADVAHEIKNPLTSLRSAVETFEIAKTDETRRKLLGVIKDDVGRIDRLISDISNASRLDAELARRESKLVDVAALIRTLAELYDMTRKEGDPQLVIRLPAGGASLEVMGLEESLGQVFRNLVDNAKSFSPEGGTVSITGRKERRDRRPVVVVTVEDEGPGIPEENLESVFRRFYTQRPNKADFGKHSGLGLSICKQIVDAHRGSIRAENIYADEDAAEPGDRILGARFIVSLPGLDRD